MQKYQSEIHRNEMLTKGGYSTSEGQQPPLVPMTGVLVGSHSLLGSVHGICQDSVKRGIPICTVAEHP